MSKADRLRALIEKHALTRAQVAEILSKELGEPVSLDTVHAWLKPEDNRSHRSLPTAKLRLLELALARRRR